MSSYENDDSDSNAQPNALKILFKWLVIACAGFTMLLLILLLLGYLLKENEQQTRQYKAELEQARQQQQQADEGIAQARSHQLSLKEDFESESQQSANRYQRRLEAAVSWQQNLTEVRQVIVNNLVCTDVSQCRLVDTKNIELGCVVSVNAIGESQLAKLNFGSPSEACEERPKDLSLICHHNICTIE